MRGAVPALLFLTACGSERDDRDRFIQAGWLPQDQAVATCLAIDDDRGADACILALQDAQDTPASELCAHPRSSDARAECWFRAAERLAEAGDRWGALEGCGQAGPFTDECLYHAWTRELQGIARREATLDDALAAADEPVAYWSQLETAGPDQPERVWGDFWTFWWTHHPPASLQACGALPPERTSSCERGTALYVERSVDQALRDPAQAAQLDRSCRAGALVDLPVALPLDQPPLQAAAERALTRLCNDGVEALRPWNPMFQPRRRR